MKTLILTFIILIAYNCKSQNILPVENEIDYYGSDSGIPENITHVKDVTGVLNKFIGTWNGSAHNRLFEFIIKKVTVKSEYRNLYKDKLLLRYKITYSTGNVIEDTTGLQDNSAFVLNGLYLAKTGSYVLYYIGKNFDCGQNGEVFIGIENADEKKMEFFLYPNGEIYDCTGGAVPQVLPTDVITLTKQ